MIVATLLKKLLLVGGGSAVKIVEPPAWTYMDTVGKIWSQESGAYFDRQ